MIADNHHVPLGPASIEQQRLAKELRDTRACLLSERAKLKDAQVALASYRARPSYQFGEGGRTYQVTGLPEAVAALERLISGGAA